MSKRRLKELEKQDCSVLKQTEGMSTGHKAEMGAGLKNQLQRLFLGKWRNLNMNWLPSEIKEL